MRPQFSLSLQGLALGVTTLAVLSGCNNRSSGQSVGGPTLTSPDNSILANLDALGLTTLRSALDASGLAPTLLETGPFTLLAPSNEAFDALPDGTLDALLEPGNVDQLRDVLSYHLANGDSSAEALSGLNSIVTVQGDEVLLDSIAGALAVNDAAVVNPDVVSSNGRIHVINSVLTPPAPVIETLQSRGFNTLVTAIQAAGLEGAVNGGNFTVLAPTDAAFDALPAGELESLLTPGNEAQLQSVLQFHLIPGPRRASELLAASSTTSLEGPLQFFALGADGPRVNTANITGANLPAEAGLIHTLDGVLIAPPTLTKLLTDQGYSAFSDLLLPTGLQNTLIEPGPFTVFAPTNEAIAALPAEQLAFLTDPANVAVLTQLLSYHVAQAPLQASDLVGQTSIDSLEGSAIGLSVDGANLLLNGSSTVISANNYAANGVLHGIDQVLMIPGL